MSDSHEKHHDYHLVDPSPWPLYASIGALLMAIGAIGWMKSTRGADGAWEGGVAFATGPWVFAIGFITVLVIAAFWWRDVVAEAHKGDHTPVVQLHLRYGMILFIASEVMFFVAWFWAYFDVSLYPNGTYAIDNVKEAVGMVTRNEVLGGQWPPVPSENFTSTFDPWGLPLVNTLILLLSGCTVTWAHHALLHDNRKSLIWGLVLTVLLGMLFTALQAYEYGHAAFNFAGNIYGATFFMATGFHGAHVIIGTIFLAVCLFRAMKGHFTPKQHFGFEAAAWYWHFVDVVWLFLFACIYVWGAGAAPGGH
ncbi:MAG: cytochrome c oxidase subunit 3 [Hyphomicrobiaceae bacterium]